MMTDQITSKRFLIYWEWWRMTDLVLALFVILVLVVMIVGDN